MVFYTHTNPDLAGIAALWAAREFIPGAGGADVVYVPYDWDGAALKRGDLALGITAGGRGVCGQPRPDGTVESCFAMIVTRWTSPRDQDALSSLVAFVDAHDCGHPVRTLAPRADAAAQVILGDACLDSVLRALRVMHPSDDLLVTRRMCEILSGLLEVGRARARTAPKLAMAL